MKEEERSSAAAEDELQPAEPCSRAPAFQQPEQIPTNTEEMDGGCCLQQRAAAAGPCASTFLRMELMSWSLASITKS